MQTTVDILLSRRLDALLARDRTINTTQPYSVKDGPKRVAILCSAMLNRPPKPNRPAATIPPNETKKDRIRRVRQQTLFDSWEQDHREDEEREYILSSAADSIYLMGLMKASTISSSCNHAAHRLTLRTIIEVIKEEDSTSPLRPSLSTLFKAVAGYEYTEAASHGQLDLELHNDGSDMLSSRSLDSILSEATTASLDSSSTSISG
ncbi:hypothetical protein DFH09DRAFT_1166393 [Mycena vulgaris]|nr:hypothetical protein DFH09DRAFT_1166393 [Mycena vulgaris]